MTAGHRIERVEQNRVDRSLDRERLLHRSRVRDVDGADDLEMRKRRAHQNQFLHREVSVQLHDRHAEIPAEIDGLAREWIDDGR